jgi:uncharacterized membrane protein YfcA
LEWVAELGLLGFIGLVSCGWLAIKNFTTWNRDVARDRQRERAALLGAAVFSMLAGSLVLIQVDSTVRIFSVYMLLLASTDVLSRRSTAADRRREPVKAPSRQRTRLEPPGAHGRRVPTSSR